MNRNMHILFGALLFAATVGVAPVAQAQYGCESQGQWDSCWGSWCTCQWEEWGQCQAYVIIIAGGGLCPYYCGFGTCIIDEYWFEYCNWEECQNAPEVSIGSHSDVDETAGPRSRVHAAIGGEHLVSGVRTLRAHGIFRRATENDPLGAEGTLDLQFSIPDGRFAKSQTARRGGQALFNIAWVTDGDQAWFRRASGAADAVRPGRIQRERDRLLVALLAIGPEFEIVEGADASIDARDSMPLELHLDPVTSLPASLHYRSSLLRMWHDKTKLSPEEAAARQAPSRPSNTESAWIGFA